MKKNLIIINFKVLFLVFFAISSYSLTANTVTGIIYDNRNNPLVDVDVELLNDLGNSVQHTRTDSGGRYSFTGLADGRFSVRVLPFRYDFEQATREITFSTFSVTGGTGTSTEILDFNLFPRKNSLSYSETKVIFTQEIPENAKNAFNRAENALKKRDLAERISALEEAIKIFPTYFVALYQLGEIYFINQDYGKAAHYLLRAADVNNRSPKSFYLLGYSLFMLKMYPSALVALNQALILSPESAEILLILGTIEPKVGKFIEAEKHLKQVKKISTNPNPEVYWQLSQLYGNYLKRYAEAADELEEYVKSQNNIQTPEQKKKLEDYKKIIKKLREKAK